MAKKEDFDRQARQTAFVIVALVAGLIFGVILLSDGDWIPGGIIVTAGLIGIAVQIPAIRLFVAGGKRLPAEEQANQLDEVAGKPYGASHPAGAAELAGKSVPRRPPERLLRWPATGSAKCPGVPAHYLLGCRFSFGLQRRARLLALDLSGDPDVPVERLAGHPQAAISRLRVRG